MALTRHLPCLQGVGVWAVVCAPSLQESRWATSVAGAALSEAFSWLGEELVRQQDGGRVAQEDDESQPALLGSLALSAASTFFLLAGALGWRRWIDDPPRRGARRKAGMWVMVSAAVFWSLAVYSSLLSNAHATPAQGWKEFFDSAFACFSDSPPDYCADWGMSDQPAWPHLPSPHEVLGCDEWSSVPECKRQYKALALALHPDKCLACRSRACCAMCCRVCSVL
jgi:hypothetical protein